MGKAEIAGSHGVVLRPGEKEEAVEVLGCKFEFIADVGNLMGRCNALLLTEFIISAQKGGKFIIDSAHGRSGLGGTPFSCSPAFTPRGSGNFSFNNLLPYTSNEGFVMRTTVSGENNCSKPTVQLGTRYVNCVEDAAVFVEHHLLQLIKAWYHVKCSQKSSRDISARRITVNR